ncbi:MAG TPA: epimerase [Polyangiaceae bacterium]
MSLRDGGLGRRDLLKAAGAGAFLSACSPSRPPSSPSPAGESATAPVASAPPPAPARRLLILGGTGFAGPPIVTAARARGHTVTLFNRGKSNPGLFPDVETILGDRQTQLDLLKGRDWDAVIDTWAPGPTLVSRAAELLKDHVGHYLFLSTISVYKLGRDPIDETSPVLTLPPGMTVKDIKKIDEKVYGPVKALAEQAAEAILPGRATSVRAGVIAGRGDPTDRFLYWPLRMSQGGEMIAPGSPDDRMTFIDVRDLGEWFVTLVENKTMGVFNAVGPSSPVLGAVLGEIQGAVGPNAKLTWIDQAWLDHAEVGGWGDFPLAVPSSADDAGFGKVSAARAMAKGLKFRPVADTARDALAWFRSQPEARRAQERPGLTPAKEADLLRRWHTARTTPG